MKLKIYQIDAFTDVIFKGYPAAVCPLEIWLDDKTMQNIAFENNLAETAFYIKKEDIYELRWFTPTTEVDLCGHATLASAYVIFKFEKLKADLITFSSPKSGILTVKRENDFLILNFPKDNFIKTNITDKMNRCFNTKPIEAYKGNSDYLFIYEKEEEISSILPNLAEISDLDARGVIVSAIGINVDFVSRFLAPQSGINEDPVTGSAHTTLIPYWSEKLGKNEMTAKQISNRGGFLKCKSLNDRVEIAGQAALFLEGEIVIS